MYGVVTRSQTKAVGTQMPNVHREDKVVDPALKPETQVRREGIPKPIPVIPKSMPESQWIIPPVLPRKGQGRAGASPAPPPIAPKRPEPPPMAMPSLG